MKKVIFLTTFHIAALDKVEVNLYNEAKEIQFLHISNVADATHQNKK